MDLEDFGSFIQKTFKRRSFRHLMKTMSHQRSSDLKSDGYVELLVKDAETELKRLIKSLKGKSFKPTSDHLQECLCLMDELEELDEQAMSYLDHSLLNELKTLVTKHYQKETNYDKDTYNQRPFTMEQRALEPSL